MTTIWTSKNDKITCSVNQTVLFEDTSDHWNNALLRLLGISDDQAREWVGAACGAVVAKSVSSMRELDLPDAIEILANAWRAISLDPSGTTPLADLEKMLTDDGDVAYANRIGPKTQFGVAGNSQTGLGWLVDTKTGKRIWDPPIEYEQEYFEGGEHGYGYGDYAAQSGWRLEKAHRQIRQMRAIGTFIGAKWTESPRVLDVGSGYGYLRKAAEDAGWRHQGIEVSQHAADICKELYGFDSIVSTLEEAEDEVRGSYDAVTMWDCIEHTGQPDSILQASRNALDDGGTLFIKTPNLLSIEQRVFGSDYHSYKAEHLIYLSPQSMAELLTKNGFRVDFLITESHLLQGFFGAQLQSYARQLHGSDLFVAATKI